jgi:hypothetical protein
MSKRPLDEEAKARFLKKYLHPNPDYAEMIWKRLFKAEQVVLYPATSKRKAYYRLA